jgi:hypothetical protein
MLIADIQDHVFGTFLSSCSGCNLMEQVGFASREAQWAEGSNTHILAFSPRKRMFGMLHTLAKQLFMF